MNLAMKMPAAFGALLLVGCAFAGSAFAQTTSGGDDKIWTGAICFPSAGNPYESVQTTASGIKNTSATPRYVSCGPAVDSEETWDFADNNSGIDTGYANLYIDLDYSTAVAATTTCVAQLVDNATNTIVETKSASVPGAAGDATVALTISNLLKGDADRTALGVSCLLPPQVKLTTINIEEFAATHQNTTY